MSDGERWTSVKVPCRFSIERRTPSTKWSAKDSETLLDRPSATEKISRISVDSCQQTKLSEATGCAEVWTSSQVQPEPGIETEQFHFSSTRIDPRSRSPVTGFAPGIALCDEAASGDSIE